MFHDFPLAPIDVSHSTFGLKGFRGIDARRSPDCVDAVMRFRDFEIFARLQIDLVLDGSRRRK